METLHLILVILKAMMGYSLMGQATLTAVLNLIPQKK